MTFWILFFISWTYSQECTTLDANTICGTEFDGFPIYDQTFEDVNLSIQQSFNKSMSDLLNLDKTRDEFVNSHGCNADEMDYAVESLRFQASFFCARSLYDATSRGCPKDQKMPLLCPWQCESALDSVTRLLSDDVICPKTSNETTLSNRSKLLDSMKLYCLSSAKHIKQLNMQDTCYKGVKVEVANAGYLSIDLAKKQCQDHLQDPFCKDLYSEKASGVVNHSPVSLWTEITLGILCVVFICAVLLFIYIFVKRPDIDLKGFIPLWKINPFKGSENHDRRQDTSHYDYTSTYTSKVGEIPSHLIDVKDESGKEIRKKNSIVLKKKSSNQSFSKISVENSYKQVTVLREFIPALKDELHLQVGQHVTVLREYDDGWASGMILETKQEGAFPLICTCFTLDDGVAMDGQTYQGQQDENPWNQQTVSKRISSKSFKRVPSASKFTLERHMFTNKPDATLSDYQIVGQQEPFELIKEEE